MRRWLTVQGRVLVVVPVVRCVPVPMVQVVEVVVVGNGTVATLVAVDVVMLGQIVRAVQGVRHHLSISRGG